MDQKHLVKLARLRTMAARASRPFDLIRFVDDQAYAVETLDQLMAGTDDETMTVLCLEVLAIVRPSSTLLGTAPAPAPAPAPARAPAPRPDPEEAARQARRAAVDARYVGRLR